MQKKALISEAQRIQKAQKRKEYLSASFNEPCIGSHLLTSISILDWSKLVASDAMPFKRFIILMTPQSLTKNILKILTALLDIINGFLAMISPYL
jgi:hypothetical protein